MADKLPENYRIERYILKRLLGKGSFGCIYEAVHMDTAERVAIKIENVSVKYPQLKWEAKVYSEQAKIAGSIVPEIYWFGTVDRYTVLIMEKLGLPLGRELPVPIANMNDIARQMLDRIRSLHQSGFIHRDIKPENFLVKGNTIYLIDMGLAKRYMQQGRHIPFGKGKHLVGTPRYASINNHRGDELSRRDDIESIAYVLIYLALGRLPWQNIPKTNGFKQEIMAKKVTISAPVLCKQLPEAFLSFLQASRKLGFEEEPRYSEYIEWFK